MTDKFPTIKILKWLFAQAEEHRDPANANPFAHTTPMPKIISIKLHVNNIIQQFKLSCSPYITYRVCVLSHRLLWPLDVSWLRFVNHSTISRRTNCFNALKSSE